MRNVADHPVQGSEILTVEHGLIDDPANHQRNPCYREPFHFETLHLVGVIRRNPRTQIWQPKGQVESSKWTDAVLRPAEGNLKSRDRPAGWTRNSPRPTPSIVRHSRVPLARTWGAAAPTSRELTVGTPGRWEGSGSRILLPGHHRYARCRRCTLGQRSIWINECINPRGRSAPRPFLFVIRKTSVPVSYVIGGASAPEPNRKRSRATVLP